MSYLFYHLLLRFPSHKILIIPNIFSRMGRPRLLQCDCGCGNWYKTQETIRRHRLKSISAKKPLLEAKTKPKKSLLSEQFKNSKNTKTVVIPIDLKGELGSMSEEVNPKKSSEDKKYHCGSCQEKFDEVPKFCPGCGAKLK